MLWYWATAVLLCHLILVCWFDFTKMIIPNVLNLSVLAFGLLVRYLVFSEPWYFALIRPVAVYCFFLAIAEIYAKLRGRQGLGHGDIKFLGAASVWVDAELLPWLVMIAAISGLVYSLAIIGARQGIREGARLPFGPHLALGLIVVWILSRYWEVWNGFA